VGAGRRLQRNWKWKATGGESSCGDARKLKYGMQNQLQQRGVKGLTLCWERVLGDREKSRQMRPIKLLRGANYASTDRKETRLKKKQKPDDTKRYAEEKPKGAAGWLGARTAQYC